MVRISLCENPTLTTRNSEYMYHISTSYHSSEHIESHPRMSCSCSQYSSFPHIITHRGVIETSDEYWTHESRFRIFSSRYHHIHALRRTRICICRESPLSLCITYESLDLDFPVSIFTHCSSPRECHMCLWMVASSLL
jgi:hypothetical protein